MLNQLFNPALKILKKTLSGRAFAGHNFGLSDLLMYANLVDDGIILQTDGSFITSFWYRGSDLETSTESELNILSEQLNRAFNLIGSGWMFHVDVIRYNAMGYTNNADCFFVNDILRFIDEERRDLYLRQGQHYENAYAINFTYKPKIDLGSKVGLFFRKDDNYEIDYSYHLRQFKHKIGEITELLSLQLNLKQMNSQMLVSYISWCLTGESVDLNLPQRNSSFLKHFLASKDLIGGENPKIGDKYFKVITIMGFPSESYPGILDRLNNIDFEYRFNTRFILIGQYEGSKIIDRISNLWYQKRISAADTIKMSLSIDSNIKINQNSDTLYQDAELAKSLNESGIAQFGFYTATVVVMNEQSKIVEQQANQIRNLFTSIGFQSQIERHHGVEAFLGSLPGYSYANVRKWIINTLNVADIVPNTSIWAGLDYNPCSFYKDNNPPLFYARTTGFTPMRISLHVNDNGHTLIIGPTGSGKSTLLNFIIAQHFRYKNARVFVFDKNCSSLPLCYGCNGAFYNIDGEQNTLSFQPLANLESDLDFDFAASWLEDICILNGMANKFDDTHRNAIYNGLRLMQSETPKDRRTISYFRHLVQDYDQAVARTLDNFSQEQHHLNRNKPNVGFIAKIFDGNSQDFILENSRFNVFEMGRLMEQGDRIVIPALNYLIHLINKQFDSCEPTLLVFDESFLFFKHPLFRDKIIEWFKTVRKFNVAIIFATQEIDDLFKYDELRSALKTNCATKFFLPNRSVLTEDIYVQYKAMGLNDKQINLIAHGLKGEYFYCSELGNRKFNLDIMDTPITFNFTARTSVQDINLAIELKKKYDRDFASHWLKAHGVISN